MSKKRKTRQEKIILHLKRQLSKKAGRGKIQVQAPEFKRSQEVISINDSRSFKKENDFEKTDGPIFFYNPNLVKKDLVKTLILSLIIFSFEVVLYFKLR